MQKMRVLIVGSMLIGDDSATGRTMENLLLPCSNIEWFQLCQDYDKNYHQELVQTVFASRQRSRLLYWIKSKYRKSSGSSTLKQPKTESKPAGSGLIGEIAKAAIDCLPVGYSDEDLRRIDSFSPQVVYTMAGSILSLRLALRMSRRYNIPILVHIMDDIENTIYTRSWATFLPRKVFLHLLKRVYGRTVYNLAIGEKMAVEYAKRHNKPFGYAMNCIDQLHYVSRTPKKKMRFVFSGGLHGGRADMIQKIGNVIQKDDMLRAMVQFDVFTSAAHVNLYRDIISGVANLSEYVPREKYYQNLQEADVLLHVESFAPEDIKYFQFSMSTKVPEYLSVGRPIICYGKKTIATVEYLDQIHAGYVVENDTQLVNALRTLLTDKTKYGEICANNITIAEKNHMVNHVVESVQDAVKKAIGK